MNVNLKEETPIISGFIERREAALLIQHLTEAIVAGDRVEVRLEPLLLSKGHVHSISIVVNDVIASTIWAGRI